MLDSNFLGLRLFIEGIEVPVIAASVRAAIMQGAQATITIPASDAVHDILPRSLVHLFYYDHLDSPEARSHEGPGTVTKTNPDKWKLLFAGEAMGFNYSKRESARQCMLHCMDFTQYWDSAKIYYGNKKNTHKQVKQNIFMGAVRAHRGRRKIDSSGDLLRILHTRSSTVPTLQGLLGGSVHLLEAITGVYDKKAARTYRGISDFYSQAELRLKLTKQIGVAPTDLTSKHFTGSKEFRTYLRRMSRSIKNTATYSQLLNVLLDRTFHIRLPVLAPPYIKKGQKAKYLKLISAGSGNTKASTAMERKVDIELGKLRDAAESRHGDVFGRSRTTAGNKVTAANDVYMYKPIDDPTRAGKIKQVIDASGQETWATHYGDLVPTAKDAGDWEQEIKDMPSGGKGELTRSEHRRLMAKASFLSEAAGLMERQLMRRVTGEIADTHTNQQNLPDQQNMFYPQHTAGYFEKLFHALNKAKSKPRVRYKTKERTLDLSDRLITTTLCPNIWMCPPPKCNVVFPDKYFSIEVSRNWMSEITRLWLFGLKASGRANWGQSYFAPNTEIIAGPKKKEMARAASQAISFLMNHEKFTGIIPSMQGLGNIEALTAVNKIVEKEEGSKPLTAFRAKNPAIARAAHAKFFEGRFAARSMQVHGTFNPRMICGLPAAIMDPVIVSDSLSTEATPQGTHYLGLVVSVVHNIGQMGKPTTSFGMKYVRAHTEGLDIFNDVDDDGIVTVEKELRAGHGRKVKHNTKEPLVAEVLGWSTKTFIGKNAQGQRVKMQRVVPVIGMEGNKSRSGMHITRGLQKQKKATPEVTANPPKSPAVPSGSAKKRDVPVAGTKLLRTKIVAKRFKGHTTSNGQSPGTITTNLALDGYKYSPRRKWMDGKALGSVIVNAYIVGGTKSGTIKKRKFSFSFEQIARPPWLSSIYLNQNIGPKFYQSLFQCDSLVDAGAAITTRDMSLKQVRGILSRKGKEVFRNLSVQEAETLRNATEGNVTKKEYENIAELINELIADQEPTDKANVRIFSSKDDETGLLIPIAVFGGITIKDALDNLAQTYLNLRIESQDLHRFIDDYTYRPVASLVDLFGYGWRKGKIKGHEGHADPDKPDDGVLGTYYVGPFSEYDPTGEWTEEVKDNKGRIREGFHSAAFGRLDNLALLPHEPLANVLGREVRDIDKRVDPRKERYKRILAYKDSLGFKAST